MAPGATGPNPRTVARFNALARVRAHLSGPLGEVLALDQLARIEEVLNE